MSLFLFDAPAWTKADLVQVIREQLADQPYSMADSLRTAVMYCPAKMTMAEFAAAAAECGIHPGTARNRYNEIRRWQRELGEIE